MGAMLVRREPTSVAAVRREIAADLAQNGVQQERADDVTLVASELVSNAVRHSEQSADGGLDVCWTISDSSVMVSVADPSGEEPVLRTVEANEPAGRGLMIVAKLASTWGVEQRQQGKRVWARVPIA